MSLILAKPIILTIDNHFLPFSPPWPEKLKFGFSTIFSMGNSNWGIKSGIRHVSNVCAPNLQTYALSQLIKRVVSTGLRSLLLAET